MTLILRALQQIELALPPAKASADVEASPPVVVEVQARGPFEADPSAVVESASEPEITVEFSSDEQGEGPGEQEQESVVPGPWTSANEEESLPQVVCEPPLADASASSEDSSAAAMEKPVQPAVDLSYRELANQMVVQMGELGHAAVLMTSPGGSVAQPAFVGPLAAALHECLGGGVLVVDANIRQPALAGWFGIWADRGLADVMAGQAAWTDLVQRTTLPGVSILPGRQDGVVPASHALRFDWGRFLEELKDQYCWIVLDGPSPDDPIALQLAAQCEATYLFLRLAHTSRRASRRAVDRLEGHGARILGSVVVAG
jgi:Mrp family chromosome partitioning ATPase